MESLDGQKKIASLAAERASRFLKRLADDSYVTLFFRSDGDVDVYVKGLTPEQELQVTQALELLAD